MSAIRGMSISFLTGGWRDVAPRRLGDVDRQVADALEVGVDLDRRDDRAQVGGHRLVQRQQREAAVVDLDVQRVDRLVAGEHARRSASRSRSTSPLTARRTCSSASPPISSSRALSCSSSSWKCRTTRSDGCHQPNLPVT